jgi:hypothetical protein
MGLEPTPGPVIPGIPIVPRSIITVLIITIAPLGNSRGFRPKTNECIKPIKLNSIQTKKVPNLPCQ